MLSPAPIRGGQPPRVKPPQKGQPPRRRKGQEPGTGSPRVVSAAVLDPAPPPPRRVFCRGKEAAEASKPTIEVEYRILEPLDLMLHVYAHIDMGENAATNHDPAYVERIREAKSTYLDSMENLEKELAAVSAMARENMRLVYLQWVGIYAESPESLVMSLRCISGEQSDQSSLSPSERGVISGLSGMLELTPGEKEVIAQLAGIISREHETFYHAYHAARMSEFEKQRDSLEEFMNKDGLPAVRPFFARGGIISRRFL